jgi:hypothetical protein
VGESTGRSSGLVTLEPVNRLDPLTVEIMREIMGQAFTYIKANVDIRFQESDLRYQQRFDGQQKALQDALSSAEKAVNAALAAADRAVLKAETAAEKRFEAVNEFRAVLSNQSATLMPRTEVDAQFKSVTEKIDDLKARFDRGEGVIRGGGDTRTQARLDMGTVISILSMIIAAGALVTAVVHHA